MNWLAAYRQDIDRYTRYSGTGRLNQLLTQQGLWALFQYRMASALFRSRRTNAVKRPLLIMMCVWQKCIEIVAGISLPYTAVIGPGLYIGHFGNVILNGATVIGSSCNLSQGVTIGVSGRGDRRGVPQIGDRVYIGANATVAGRITVGNDVVVAANSLVTSDVPNHCTVVGVPAVIVNSHGSDSYLNPAETVPRRSDLSPQRAADAPVADEARK
jgi:serine O-acetyltransferase